MHYTASYKNRYRLSLPVRASFWYTAAAVLERGAALIFTPLFTRLLAPGEYGVYSLYTSFMGIFTVFITLELSGNIVYRGLSGFRGREAEFMRAALGLISLSALLFAVVLSVFGAQLSAITGLSIQALSFLAIQVYLNGIVNLYTARERYRYRYYRAILPNLAISVLSPLLAFVITRFFGVGAPSRIYAFIVVTALIALPLAASVMEGGIRFSPNALRLACSVSLPLLPHFIAASVSAQAGRAIVGIFRGEGELAVYSVVFSLGFVFSLVTGGLLSSLSPWISRKLSHGGGYSFSSVTTVHNTVNGLLPPICIASLIFLCFSREALFILAPPEYQAALLCIVPITLFVLLNFVLAVQTSIILYYDAGAMMSVASVVSALLNLSLNLLLTPVYGYIAAAIIQAGGALLNLLLYSLVIRVRSGARLSYSRYIFPLVLTAAVGTLIIAMSGAPVARGLLALALTLLFIIRAAPLRKFIFDRSNANMG